MLEPVGDGAPLPDACIDMAVIASAVAVGSLRCTIVAYEEPEDGDIEQTRAVVQVLEACPSLGLTLGAAATIAMGEHPADPARLVDDLLGGNPQVGVPACDPGSIVVFSGCTPGLDGGPVQASDFVVHHVANAGAELATGPSSAFNQDNSDANSTVAS